ncbi:SDR family oxidoreductase [uncultured Amnibacterium sp.]|uniref:SDR family oxidoreductase n=1 Tax=uncultured Amnibacterium sp. TaxID=1631851 RepID=UPI0035CBE3AC
MDLALASARAIVTGDASGIGGACAAALAAEGVQVGVIDRDAVAGAAVAARLNDVVAQADVADEPSVRAAIESLAEALGGIRPGDGLRGCARPLRSGHRRHRHRGLEPGPSGQQEAVVQLTRALSTDLAPERIRVNRVCPSVVNTPMSHTDVGVVDFDTVTYPVQSPDEVARHVAYLCSPASLPINGTTLVSDFGYLARSSFPA